jgi:thymidylate kinase/energy-coupling factor transporter ATP-binding protein EcfA2
MRLIKVFLENLEKSNISYVHWKNNTFIDEALSGDDDLDILVDVKQKATLFSIFEKLKIFRAHSYEDKWHKEITHFYGIDIESKKIFHIHLHFNIEIGFDYDLCYNLPIVNNYLNNRIKYKELIYIPNFENEYILLIIRLILKNALTPFLLMLPHKQFSSIKSAKQKGVVKGGGYREFLDLRSKINSEKLKICLECNFSFLSHDTFKNLESLLNDNSSVIAFFKAGRKLKDELRDYRSCNEFTSIRRAFFRLYSIRFFLLLRKLHVYNKIEGKKLENGGRIIAFVGGDGAGKTTTISNLRETLKSQFSLKSIHVGKPSMHLKGLVFRLISKIFSLIGFKNLSKAFFYISIAINRKNEFRKACKLRDKGIIILQDRMPLEGITAMDCPRVHTILNGKYKKLSKLEKNQYVSIKKVDMLFIMKLNPEIALQRRPEDDPDELRIRSGQIWNNDWVAPFAHEINTGENNPEQVQNILLKKVWENFNTPFIRAEIIGLNGTGKSTLFKKIEQKMPNVLKSIPVKDYPFLIIQGLFFGFLRGTKIYFKTRNTSLLRNYFHLIISLQVLQFWNKKNSLPSKNFIFDQGPYFQAALLYKEKCISKSKYLKYILELQKNIPLVFTLTASNEVLYERVIKRKGSDGRGQHMSFKKFCNFCEEYKKTYEIVREKVKFHKKINTENKSVEQVYQSFKEKAYGSI